MFEYGFPLKFMFNFGWPPLYCGMFVPNAPFVNLGVFEFKLNAEAIF